ncbi:MAG TPA: serine/threonine-protein kinase [Polyangiaceae bacterium]
MSYPEAGEIIDGKYKIEGYIGEGGMGAVARAQHLVRKAPVALKFMSPAVTYVAGAIDRFVNEAVAASALKSDHVVQVFDVGKLPDDSPFLVLELLDGHDAAALLEKEPQGIEVPRAAHIVLQVLRALEVAHAAGIIHRDLKPSNCFLVSQDGDAEFVKLLDFGISKITTENAAESASLTQTNTALGTPLYMSPEQARSARKVDFRTDIYSAGVILYELLSGNPPHLSEGGEVTEVLYKLFTTDAPSIAEKRANLPPALAVIVHKALARDPAARFSSAHEFAEALVPFCDARSASEIAKLKAKAASTAPGVPSGAPRVRVQSHADFVSSDEHAATQLGASSVSGPSTGAIHARPETSEAIRTDLGSAHDSPPAAPPKSSRVPVIIGAVGALAVLATIGVVMTNRQTPPRPDDNGKTQTTIAPPPSSLTTVAPSATVSAVPSAVVTAAPSATPTVHVTVTHGTNTVQSRSLGWGNVPHN